jgi:uncharacterized protein YbjQ (UPF0145 family)
MENGGRNRGLTRVRILTAGLVCLTGCASAGLPEFKPHAFPDGKAFVADVPADKKYEDKGIVRVKLAFSSMDATHEDDELCKNAYNEAVGKLVDEARKKGGDAVILVRSVTFYMDGSSQTHSTAECSDDGSEGQVLVKGLAVKWLTDSTTPTQDR